MRFGACSRGAGRVEAHCSPRRRRRSPITVPVALLGGRSGSRSRSSRRFKRVFQLRSCRPDCARIRRPAAIATAENQGMAWNDERVELLKKLWSDGLSASQIAGRLGGVTRNAVIGKVHRLGLSGRATTSRMKSHRPRARSQIGQAPDEAALCQHRQPGAAPALPRRCRALHAAGRGAGDPAQRAQIDPDADRDVLPLADRRSPAWPISTSAAARR